MWNTTFISILPLISFSILIYTFILLYSFFLCGVNRCVHFSVSGLCGWGMTTYTEEYIRNKLTTELEASHVVSNETLSDLTPHSKPTPDRAIIIFFLLLLHLTAMIYIFYIFVQLLSLLLLSVCFALLHIYLYILTSVIHPCLLGTLSRVVMPLSLHLPI